MNALNGVVESFRARIGTEKVESLGRIDHTMIRRYAHAVGETNPVYYESDAARDLGHADIVAPPNFLTAVVYWDEGEPTALLNADGTSPNGRLGALPDGIRVMGGGEHLRFHRCVTAGIDVERRTTLESVDLKDARSGPLCRLTYLEVYVEVGGAPLLTNEKVLLLR